MSNPLLNGLVESYPVELYDMSILDINERKEKKIFFQTAMKAANFLGMTPKKIYDAIGIGHYAYHRETKKKYAVRRVIEKNDNSGDKVIRGVFTMQGKPFAK